MKRRKLSRDDLIALRKQGESWDAGREKRGEEGKVTFLLKQIKAPKKKWDMLKRSKELTGESRLSLDLFNEMVPNWPIVMGYAPVRQVDKLHADNRATLSALMTRFMDAPFIAPYEEWFERATSFANGRAVGLLFNRKGIQQGLILHDAEGLDAYWRPGTEMRYHGGTREKPVVLQVESFACLVKAITDTRNSGWRPEFAF